MAISGSAGVPATNPEAKRILLLTIYAVAFLGFLLPNAGDPVVVWVTMAATLVPLWFGPFALLVPRCGRRWYDPAVLFNTMMFYYTIKGVTLAFDSSIPYVAGMSPEVIHDAYLFAILNVIAGTLAWNLGFLVVMRHLPEARKDRKSSPVGGRIPEPWWQSPVSLLTVVGVTSTVLFFQSTGQSILGFLLNPLLRSYLTDGSLGVQAPLANLWKLGAFLWPLGSLVWVSQLCWTGARRPGVLWLHVVLGAAMYFLIGGRIDTLGFLLGVLLVFNILTKTTSRWVFTTVGGAGFGYAYLINLWRELWGQDTEADFGARAQALGEMQHGLKGITDLLAGNSLSDIRLLVKIADVYGRERALEYGETLTRVVTQFIPRSLWPQKPLDLSVVVNSLYDWNEGMAGTPPGFIGEMFMNFHLPGVVVGCTLLGATFAWLYYRWALSACGPFDTVKYALLAPIAAIMPSATFANVVSGAGVPILALIFLERWFGEGGSQSVEIQ